MSPSRAVCPTRGEKIACKYEWQEGQPQACHLCATILFSPQQWMDHVAKEHKRQLFNEGQYHCPFSTCTRAMKTWSNLSTHICRHLDLMLHQCTEWVEMPNPQDPPSYIYQQCPVRETDAASLNRHRVRCHGHQRKRRGQASGDDNNGESSSNGRVARVKRSATAVRKSPYAKSPNHRTLPFSEAFAGSHRSAEATSYYKAPSSPTSSAYSAPSPASSDRSWSPEPYHPASSPSHHSSESSALSPASTDCSPSSPYSAPSPTFSGATSPSSASSSPSTSPSPSRSPSPLYIWDTPVYPDHFTTPTLPLIDNITVVSPEDVSSWEQFFQPYPADFLSPEALGSLDTDFTALYKNGLLGSSFLS